MKIEYEIYALSILGKKIAGMPLKWLKDLLSGIIPRTSDLKVLRTSDSLIIRLKEE
jgi:hypothetical protein